MFPEERKNRIKQMVLENRSVTVSALVKIFNVSEETIRRDLKCLQEENIIKKTYGVATLSDELNNINVPTIQKRKFKEHREKIAIAEEAIKLLYNNKYILLDAGSTTECIAKKLKKINYTKNISIITNGINVAEECSKISYANVYLLGGELQKRTLSIVGPQVIQEIKSYNIDIAVMGVTGISNGGFYSSNIYEIEVKKTMVSEARKVVVVADHTKFGKRGLKPFCSFENVDYLITSDLLDNSTLKSIKANHRTKIIIVQMASNVKI
jgi:DeoR family transcriptional regulator of aga operon/DeoR family myo-inositol catabolism operon transcriptional repressor